MKRLSYFLVVALLATISGCGGSNTTPSNVGLVWQMERRDVRQRELDAHVRIRLGDVAVRAARTIAVPRSPTTARSRIPSNMCINGNALSATATTSGNNFTMTVTDPQRRRSSRCRALWLHKPRPSRAPTTILPVGLQRLYRHRDHVRRSKAGVAFSWPLASLNLWRLRCGVPHLK